MRGVVCFLVLPMLPTVAFLLLCACPIPIFRDRIVVIVLTAVLATVGSATVGFRVRRNPLVAVLYALTTAALSVLVIAATIAILFTIACGDYSSGSC